MLQKHNQSASNGNFEGSSHVNEDSSVAKGEDDYYEPASYLEADAVHGQGGTMDTRVDLFGMPVQQDVSIIRENDQSF